MLEHLKNPNVIEERPNGELAVNLTNLAVLTKTPITRQNLGYLSILVQRHFKRFAPDAECRLETDRRLIIPAAVPNN